MNRVKKTIILILCIILIAYLAVAFVIYDHHSSVDILCEDGSYAAEYAQNHHLDYSISSDSSINTFREEYEQFEYTVNGRECTIVRYSGNSKDLTIPSFIDGLIVTAIDAAAFDNCDHLERVYVPNSVLRFGPTQLGGIVVYCSPDSPTFQQLAAAKESAEEKAAAANAEAWNEVLAAYEAETASDEIIESEREDDPSVKIDDSGLNIPTIEIEEIEPEKTTEYQSWEPAYESGLPFEYNEHADGIEIVRWLEKDRIVVVPAAVNGTPVNSISFPVLGLGIEMVFIPASVTSINMQFATPRYDAAFWINLLIVLIGCAFAVTATVAAVKENSTSDRKFLGLSLVYTGVKYYTLLIIVSAVSLIVGLPLLVQIIAAIIFVALGAAEFIKTKTAAEIVEQVDEKVTVQTSFIKTMTSEAERLMSRVSEPEEKAVLREVCEALRYSDPMSSQELSEIETKISEKFDELSSAVVEHSTEKTKTIASELVTLVGERNRKCKGIK